MKLQISVSSAAGLSELYDYANGSLGGSAQERVQKAVAPKVGAGDLGIADDGNGNSCVYLESGKRTYYFVQASDAESSRICAMLARAYPNVKKAKGIVVFSAPSNKVLSQVLSTMTASNVQYNGEYKNYLDALSVKRDAASMSAASPLTPFGKQVRALESQAAKARKLFDAAKEAEAAGKNIDTRVARLQEVLGGSTTKTAPAVKSPGADFTAQVKDCRAAFAAVGIDLDSRAVRVNPRDSVKVSVRFSYGKPRNMSIMGTNKLRTPVYSLLFDGRVWSIEGYGSAKSKYPSVLATGASPKSVLETFIAKAK